MAVADDLPCGALGAGCASQRGVEIERDAHLTAVIEHHDQAAGRES